MQGDEELAGYVKIRPQVIDLDNLPVEAKKATAEQWVVRVVDCTACGAEIKKQLNANGTVHKFAKTCAVCGAKSYYTIFA